MKRAVATQTLYYKKRKKIKTKKYHQSSITNTSLSFGGANMGVMHLCRELETGQRLCHMCLQWTDHHKHESLGIASEGELEKIGELKFVLANVFINKRPMALE